MAVSKVVEGQRATAQQYNALVDAVQDPYVGHNHNGQADGGARVAHADLVGATDGQPGGHTHAQLDTIATAAETHIAATGGVHGAPGWAHYLPLAGQAGLVAFVEEIVIDANQNIVRTPTVNGSPVFSEVLYVIAGPVQDSKSGYPIWFAKPWGTNQYLIRGRDSLGDDSAVLTFHVLVIGRPA